MELEGTTTRSVADISEVILPQLPPMSDALPIVAADSALERPSMPRPRPRPRVRERHHQSHNHQSQSSHLMELLSRRLSRQNLLQQNQSRTSQLSLTPQPTSPSMPSHSQPPLVENATLDSSLCASNDMTMEVDLDEADGNSLALPTLPCARRIRPSRRYLPLPYVPPAVPETKIDTDVASRVLARMQADVQPASGSASQSTSPSSVLAIEIDPAEQADVDLEADEGYSEGLEEYPWLGDKPPTGLTGAMRSQGFLSFTTSAEAALRCPKLVLNVPRMRKRSQKKKEHRLRTLRETAGEMSQPRAPAGDCC
ncbi:hypothetical protein V8C37DRAFT_145467 [Trichoderma ceciliae]